jgi:hypothetical protein
MSARERFGRKKVFFNNDDANPALDGTTKLKSTEIRLS